jgi:hypothetical protein
MNPYPHAPAQRPRMSRGRLPLVVLLALVACGDGGPTGPDGQVGPNPVDPPVDLPPTDVSRDDLSPEGTVVDTEDGYTVAGALTMETSDSTSVTFLNADLRVRFDDQDRVTSISGTTEIPSPHPRIRFHDPVQAEVGFFTGAYLNENRDLGIRLLDDEDYFVYHVAIAIGMDIATGETGDEATKPVTVKVPVGGRILQIIDYDDPMYFVFGEQDLIGSAGIGWSRNGRFPFEPRRSVAGLGQFEGKSIRTGTFPIFKIFSITGETVDNNYTELHLTEEDPFSAELRRGYQQGWNGDFELDLSIKDMVGITIPVADGSGGIFGETSTTDGLQGHAYGTGATTRDFSWYPEFIPMKPASTLDVEAFVTHEGRFKIGLEGQYGWEFADGLEAMNGALALSDDAFAVAGSIVNGADSWGVTGRVTEDTTVVALDYPSTLTDAVAVHVNDEVLPRIDSAQAAWEDVEEATADYEFELSLRGIRTQIPAIVANARDALDAAVAAELSPHKGKVYYNTLKSEMNRRTAPYYASLDRLDAEARRTTDNAATRQAIDSALRDVAAKKIFRTTITIKVLGVTVYNKSISRRIMSDANADKLLEAASYVPFITTTSDRKIRMEQIYDAVPDRELFEQVRDDIQDGLVVIEDMGTVGFIYPHAEGARAFNVFVGIDGRLYQPGTVSNMTVTAWAALIWDSVLEALKVN